MFGSSLPYSIVIANVLASGVNAIDAGLDDILQDEMQEIKNLVLRFVSQPLSPAACMEFEQALQNIVRELGRKVMEFTCNECEPASSDDAPHDVTYEAGGYRRMDKKTANRYVETTFGRIELWRRGYRYWHRDQKAPNIFPVELVLGLVKGATPLLAGELSRLMAEAGATQSRVLEQANRQFNVSLGVERLREMVEDVSASMERFREQYQVLKLLDLLHQAHASHGRCKPVLSVGRDGISMPIHKGGGYKQGAVATVAVYDRRGQRVGIVYLATCPESGQPTLTRELTALIKSCLSKWCVEEGKRLPRLCYVTDAGDMECGYYANVLSRMRHPKQSGRYLRWHRIVDYYHTTERITVMAEAIFGPGYEASHWARKMRKLLVKPSGVYRVLHSAAAMKTHHGIRPDFDHNFELAYNYIRSRARHMRYAEFKSRNLPIGSGVTEAACKTIFTQRLKLSGMGWTHQGAATVLRLRVILLSGVWDEVYKAAVNNRNPINLRTYAPEHLAEPQNAA